MYMPSFPSGSNFDFPGRPSLTDRTSFDSIHTPDASHSQLVEPWVSKSDAITASAEKTTTIDKFPPG